MAAHEAIAMRWEQLKSQDMFKDELFRTLLQNYQEAILERQALGQEIKTLKYNERNLHRDREVLESQLSTLQDHVKEQSESSPFALVLIDGDAAPFRDEFIKDAVQGGRRAVHQLNEQIREILKSAPGYQPHWQLVVRVYAKLSGLALTYFRSGITDSKEILSQFVRGFNEVHPLSEIIDAGDDKEGADTKVEQNLKLFATNSHCKQIILAASADKSYVRHLRPYALTSARQDSLILIESIPFPLEFRELASKFQIKQLAEILRDTKIEAALPPVARQLSNTVSYAARASQPTGATESPRPAVPASAPNAVPDKPANKAFKEPKITLNRANERIDRPLGYVNQDMVNELWNKKLCNRHFLTKCTSYNCPHKHDYGPLSEEQKNALRRVARSSVCQYGLECNDPYCTSAHNCAYLLSDCHFRRECKFPHAEDLKIVKEV